MSTSNTKQISLWLTPLPNHGSQTLLRHAVKAAALAPAHTGPQFEPHITLHTIQVPSSEVEATVSKVKLLSSSLAAHSLALRFSGLKQGSTRHQSVLAEVTKTDDLLKLKNEAASLLGGSAAGYYPHLSLWYGEDASKRQAAFSFLTSHIPTLNDVHYDVTGIDGT